MLNNCSLSINSITLIDQNLSSISIQVSVPEPYYNTDIKYRLYDINSTIIKDWTVVDGVPNPLPLEYTFTILASSIPSPFTITDICTVETKIVGPYCIGSGSESGSGSGCECQLDWNLSDCVDATISPCYIDDGKLPPGPLPSSLSLKVSKEIYINDQLYTYDSIQNKWISDSDSLSLVNGKYSFTYNGYVYSINPAVRYRELYSDYTLFENGAGCDTKVTFDFEIGDANGNIYGTYTFAHDFCAIINGNIQNKINWSQNLPGCPGPINDPSIFCLQDGETCEETNFSHYVVYSRSGSTMTRTDYFWSLFNPIDGGLPYPPAVFDPNTIYGTIGIMIQNYNYSCSPPSISQTSSSSAFAYFHAPLINGYVGNIVIDGSPIISPNFSGSFDPYAVVSFTKCPLSITYGSTCRLPNPTANCETCINSPSVDYTTLPNYGSYFSGCTGRPIDIDIDACDGTIHPMTFSKPNFVLYYQGGGPSRPFLIIDDIAYDARGAGLIKVFSTTDPQEMRKMVCERLRFASLVDETKLTTNINEALTSNWPYNDLYWYSACGNLPDEVAINLIPC